MYVHPSAQGRHSLKKILPAVSDLSYEELEIQDGTQAMCEWSRMMSKERGGEEKKLIAENLRKYCSLDTYSMYVIWKHLKEIT